MNPTLIWDCCGEIICRPSSFSHFRSVSHFSPLQLSSSTTVCEGLRASQVHSHHPSQFFYGYVSLSSVQPRCTLDRRGVGREALSVPVSGSDDTSPSARQQLSGGNVDIHCPQESSPTLTAPVNRPSSILCLHHTGSQTFPKSSLTGALHPVIHHFLHTYTHTPPKQTALSCCIACVGSAFGHGRAGTRYHHGGSELT